MALPQRRTPHADLNWRAHYRIENPADVDAYVAEHPSVMAILDEAPTEIHAVFSHEDQLRLALHWNPEAGDCWLFIGIPSADIGPSVLPLIHKLDERWSLNPIMATDATVAYDVVGL
jgi:hypothetical protein